MKLGNGLWETAQVDHLGQLTQVGLGTSQTNNDLFKVDYEYGELQTNGTVDATKNIGNIAKTTTTIPTTSFVQTFKYDAINWLTEAREITGVTENWKQTFGYDRFGNRTSFSETIGGVLTQNNALNHPMIDAANNRFTTGQGYVYGFNGISSRTPMEEASPSTATTSRPRFAIRRQIPSSASISTTTARG